MAINPVSVESLVSFLDFGCKGASAQERKSARSRYFATRNKFKFLASDQYQELVLAAIQPARSRAAGGGVSLQRCRPRSRGSSRLRRRARLPPAQHSGQSLYIAHRTPRARHDTRRASPCHCRTACSTPMAHADLAGDIDAVT